MFCALTLKNGPRFGSYLQFDDDDDDDNDMVVVMMMMMMMMMMMIVMTITMCIYPCQWRWWWRRQRRGRWWWWGREGGGVGVVVVVVVGGGGGGEKLTFWDKLIFAQYNYVIRVQRFLWSTLQTQKLWKTRSSQTSPSNVNSHKLDIISWMI